MPPPHFGVLKVGVQPRVDGTSIADKPADARGLIFSTKSMRRKRNDLPPLHHHQSKEARMSDWQVGDLARATGAKREDFPNMRFVGRADGKIRRVAGVVHVGDSVGLIFEGWPSCHSTGSWNALSFRKIRPDEHDACEPEFAELLKRQPAFDEAMARFKRIKANG
jgi:hypothetical protein